MKFIRVGNRVRGDFAHAGVVARLPTLQGGYSLCLGGRSRKAMNHNGTMMSEPSRMFGIAQASARRARSSTCSVETPVSVIKRSMLMPKCARMVPTISDATAT